MQLVLSPEYGGVPRGSLGGSHVPPDIFMDVLRVGGTVGSGWGTFSVRYMCSSWVPLCLLYYGEK